MLANELAAVRARAGISATDAGYRAGFVVRAIIWYDPYWRRVGSLVM
jgi:hypothetical protein